MSLFQKEKGDDPLPGNEGVNPVNIVKLRKLQKFGWVEKLDHNISGINSVKWIHPKL